MSHCPSCGRYVGPYEACPYCGARMTGRLPIRTAKIAAGVLAGVGLALLWFVTIRSPVPSIQIGRAGSTMNMAYAQVEGQVVRGPDYYPDSGYLAFTLADDTGEIRVSAYRNEADRLRAERRVPALGDRVRVAGTLRVREAGVALTLNAPDHLELLRPEAVERPLGAITSQDHLLRVRVRGQVWAVRLPHDDLILITLRDATGAIDVAVGQELQALTGDLLPPHPGSSVEVVGTVDLYRETPQIVPASVQDIVPLPEPVPVATQMSVGSLTEGSGLVRVKGTLTHRERFSGGLKFTLNDGTGEVLVLLWDDVYQSLDDPEGLRPGAQVEVMGQVAVYHGDLEVIPERAMDVEIGAIAPPLSLGELSHDRRGEVVAVEGEVVSVASFSNGFKFTIDDGTGQGVILLWLSVYDEVATPSNLHTGARVRVTGAVEEYEGQLQVVPEAGVDVRVLSPGALQAPLRGIGSLTTHQIGTAVTVEGAVTRMAPFASGQRLWLGDGTGEVMVLVWDNVYQRVPGREGLALGAWLRVAGLVEAYEGAFEVIPQLPHDIEVLDQ